MEGWRVQAGQGDECRETVGATNLRIVMRTPQEVAVARRKNDSGPRDMFELHSEYCAMFSNPARLRLVWTIGNGERTVTSLARELEMSVSTVSRHLSKLRDKGVVEARRSGANLYYRVASPHFLEGCQGIRRGILDVIHRNREAFAGADEG